MQTKAERLMLLRFSRNRNMLVPFYIMCCYAYYEQDDPLVSDAFFDRLAKVLLDEFDNVTHYHKRFLTREELAAATYSGVYPTITEGAVASFRSRFTK